MDRPLGALSRDAGPRSIYEMTADDVAAFLKRSDAVIVPIGQIAQHGPHLPLAADVIQAREVCRRVVRRLDDQGFGLLLGPTIPFGHSSIHHEFAGTVELEPETLALVVRDVGRSLVRQGFRSVVLFCCGGGNWAGVENAAYHLWREEGAAVFVLGFFETVAPAAKQFLEAEARGGHDGHAGELETSCVLAAAPQLVDMSRAADVRSAMYHELSGLPFTWMNFNEQLRAVGLWSVRPLSESGAWGDATLASAEKGERILDHAAEVLADHLKRYVFKEASASAIPPL